MISVSTDVHPSTTTPVNREETQTEILMTHVRQNTCPTQGH